MNREILLPITFREFDDSVDAKIQEKWLESLSKQTYRNFRLIATNFQEKNVKNMLDKYNVKHVFIQSDKTCRFSWPEVFLNVRQFLVKDKSIVLWTTPDHFFDDDFFEKIDAQFEAGCAGTSYPHHIYKNLDEMKEDKLFDEYHKKYINTAYEYDPNLFLPEVIFIDGNIFLEGPAYDKVKEYEFDGPGPGIAMFYYIASWARHRINIFHHSKVRKIGNDDTVEHFSHNTTVWLQNEQVVLTYCHDVKMPMKYFKGTGVMTRKYHQHSSFKLKGTLAQKLRFKLYYLYWFFFPKGEFLPVKLCKSLIRRAQGNLEKGKL